MHIEAIRELARAVGLRHRPTLDESGREEMVYPAADFELDDFAQRHRAWSALWAHAFESAGCRLAPDMRQRSLTLVVPLSAATTEAQLRPLFNQIRLLEQHLP